MNRAALRLIAVFLLIIGLACPASAQTTKTAWEKQIGTDCNNGSASADFDTLAQCSATSGSGTFQKAPLFVGQVTSPPYASTACDAAKAGMLQYTGGVVQYCNGSAWSTMGSSSGTGGQSMFSGLPDVIICSYPGNYLPFYQHGTDSSGQTQYNTVDNSGRMIFFDSSGNYNSNSYASDFDCVTNARSLSYLVANGKAFNFVNGGANGAAAMADGTAGAPGLYFSADTNTGLYRPTTDNLAIATGGVERLRVTATGSVGIGTTTPLYPLHVAGPIWSSNSSDFSFVMKNTAANGAQWSMSNIAGSGNAGGLRFYNDTNAAEYMRITNAGNVGIGISNPGGAKLYVAGALNSSGGDFSFLDAGVVDSTAVRLFSNSGNLYLQNGSGGATYFRSKSGVSNVTILDNGYVGIGTTSPANLLTVTGTIQTTTGGIKYPDGTTQATAGMASLNTNGYQKLPSGLIIQWGAGVITSISGTAFTFPTAFPTTLLTMVVGGYNGGAVFPVSVGSQSKTGFTAYSTAPNVGFSYTAFGY